MTRFAKSCFSDTKSNSKQDQLPVSLIIPYLFLYNPPLNLSECTFLHCSNLFFCKKKHCEWSLCFLSIGSPVKKNSTNINSGTCFSLVQQSNSGLGHLIVEVSRSHTIRHTHWVGLLWMINQLIAQTDTYTVHSMHKRRTIMLSVAFRVAIPAMKKLHTSALDGMTTGKI
jgi:hypothetical protein